MLVIDPDECIDCGVCVEECPVRAIYCDEEVPEKWQEYIEINQKYSKLWPVIRDSQDPLPTADSFSETENKRSHFDPEPGLGSRDSLEDEEE